MAVLHPSQIPAFLNMMPSLFLFLTTTKARMCNPPLGGDQQGVSLAAGWREQILNVCLSRSTCSPDSGPLHVLFPSPAKLIRLGFASLLPSQSPNGTKCDFWKKACCFSDPSFLLLAKAKEHVLILCSQSTEYFSCQHLALLPLNFWVRDKLTHWVPQWEVPVFQRSPRQL